MRQNEAGARGLSSRQAAAAAALLEGMTQAEAAAVAGVGRATLARWQGRPEFRAVLQDGQRAAVENAARQLLARLTEAINTAAALMTDADAPASARLAAARLLLDQAGRYHELMSLEQRLEALEKWRHEQNRGTS